MKISFITTIYNEEKTIEKLLESLDKQTKIPYEIMIVDGGSTDRTLEILAKNNVRVIVKRGNRSVGRNEAIKQATGDIIVCSDAGNVLDKDWIREIIKPFEDEHVSVIAGYYEGIAETVFQKCLIPYVLVMPDRINPQTFLPATRSIAFRRSVWERVDGFDERLSHNEDHAFAKKLQREKMHIVFQRDAVVYWMPRKTVKEAYVMFLRFAYGDAEARIFRPKVLVLFARYVIVVIMLILAIMMKSSLLLDLLFVLFLLYCVWSVKKNYKYVRDERAYFYLPLLQLTSDIAVLHGTISGLLHLWDTKKTL
jgi:glycosyltransferase involved in cell wall biosynthesis